MFKTGQYVMFESGEYPNRIGGPFVVLVDFDKHIAVNDFTNSTPDKPHRQHDDHEFVLWLLQNSYIAVLTVEYWKLSDNCFTPLDFGVASYPDYFDSMGQKWEPEFDLTPEAEDRREREDAEYEVERASRRSANPLDNITTSLSTILVGNIKD